MRDSGGNCASESTNICIVPDSGVVSCAQSDGDSSGGCVGDGGSRRDGGAMAESDASACEAGCSCWQTEQACSAAGCYVVARYGSDGFSTFLNCTLVPPP